MQVVAMIDAMFPAFAEHPRKGLNTPAFKLMREILGRDDFDAIAMLEGRRIYLQGRAAALESAAKAELDGRDEAELIELAEKRRKGAASDIEQLRASGIAPQQAALHSPSHSSAPVPHATNVQSFLEKADGYSPAISALVIQ